MKSIPISSENSDIQNLIVEWNELLAQEKYEEALELFPHSTENTNWTPQLLKAVINGYGVIDPDKETLEFMLNEYEVEEFKISSLHDLETENDIFECIEVDRDNLYGLNPEKYLGMVHFNDVPLNGFISDLTARFHIKRVNDEYLTLEFLDLHVL